MNDMKSENVIINAEEQFKSNNAQTVADRYKSMLSNKHKTVLSDLRLYADEFETSADNFNSAELEVLTRMMSELAFLQHAILQRACARVLFHRPFELQCRALSGQNYYSQHESFVLTFNDLIYRDYISDHISIRESEHKYSNPKPTYEFAKLCAQENEVSIFEALSMPLICEPFVFFYENDDDVRPVHLCKIHITESDCFFLEADAHAYALLRHIYDNNPQLAA